MLHIAKAVSALGGARVHDPHDYALAPRCRRVSPYRATSRDKWLVGFRVHTRGPAPTWFYYVVDHASDAMDAKQAALSMAGDEIDAPCPHGFDAIGRTEIRILYDDGIGPRRLLPST
ncbi:hypothetical protein PV703_18990 [Streptomyces sp. ME01-24h]|nr:hypothetical protein [Streptomyces sp. ME19-03-3]MDX3355358.1 hypothetical protein [Streptomyces sp. ME01-24h]